MIALAALSEGNVLDTKMLRSVALLSPIAYMGQLPEQPLKTVAEGFVVEVRINPLLSASDIDSKDRR